MQSVLLQTTIEDVRDDCNIDRFGQLRAFLSSLLDANGKPTFRVTARNRTRPCPSFVTEAPADGMVRFPEALRSAKQYVRNIAFWLGEGARSRPT